MAQNEKIIAFELWDPMGVRVAFGGDFDSLPRSFHLKANENFQENGLRNIYRIASEGSVRLVVFKDNPFFLGTKGVARGCAVYLSLIPQFKVIENNHRQHFDAIIKRFAHNLIKFQNRFKGNFSRLISDVARSRPFSEFKAEVKRRIEEDVDSAANDVSQMSHRAVDLDAQIETLRIISGYADSPAPENFVKANLQKTIFRLVNPFIEELEGKGITVDIRIPNPVNANGKVLIDPNLFNAAIWQLLDNASKYVKQNTQIKITAELNSNPQRLELVMTSVCIDPDEEEIVFLERKKGRHSGKKGQSGIGLFVVRKALGLMGAKIYVKNEGEAEEYQGFKYCKHRFTIEFSR